MKHRTTGRQTVRAQTVRAESLEARRLFALDLAIDPAVRAQTMDGFGTALSGWKPSLYADPAFASMYYQDLGVSMMRVALDITALPGPDGDLATPVTFGTNLQDNIALFDFNTPNIRAQGTVARESIGRAVDSVQFVASIWTPPHWMKGEEISPATGRPNGVMPRLETQRYAEINSSGGSLIDTEENRTQFGRYVAAYLKGFEQTFGVSIGAVSLQNELYFHEPYNSCVYDPALYVKTIKSVARVFSEMGITTKLIGPEEVGVGSTQDPYILRRSFTYINAIKSDPEANAAIHGYAIHGYASDGVNANRSPEMWNQYWNGRTTYPTWSGIKNDNKRSWMTEVSGDLPTFDGAMSLALGVQDALVQANTSAWFYWQIQNSPTLADAGSLTAGNSTSLPKYAAAKHFFRYIRPGAQRVSVTPSDPYGVYASAFVHDTQRTLTSVVINSSNTAQEIRLNIGGGLSVSSFDVARITDATQTFANLTGLSLSGGVATFTLPARSIVTLQGSTAPAQPTGSDVALRKPVTASSSSGALIPANVNDGLPKTRWSSAYADNQWLQIDLGQVHQITGLQLSWEAAYARSYQVQTSTDAQTWTTIHTNPASTGGNEAISGLTGQGRYVRLALLTRATRWGFSLFNVSVIGTAMGTNLALNRATTTSSTSGGHVGSRAVDGILSSRWSSAYADNQWLQIDLGAERSISNVILNWEKAHATAYQIQLSSDNPTWSTAFSTTTGDGGIDDVSLSGRARFVRIVGVTRATRYGISLWEVQILGT